MPQFTDPLHGNPQQDQPIQRVPASTPAHTCCRSRQCSSESTVPNPDGTPNVAGRASIFCSISSMIKNTAAEDCFPNHWSTLHDGAVSPSTCQAASAARKIFGPPG